MVEQFRKAEWVERTPGIARRVFRTIALDLLIGLLLFAGMETGLRTFVPETSRLIFTKELSGGHSRKGNSLGLRDDEFPVQRPPGELRILALGNSTTWGTGVDQHDTYANQLERALGADHVQVINAGGEGKTLDKAIAFMDRSGFEYDPSTVLYGFSPSIVAKTADSKVAVGTADGVGSHAKRTTAAMALDLQTKLYGYYTFAFLDNAVRHRMYRWGLIRDRMDKQSGAIFAYAFDVPGVDQGEVEAAYLSLFARLEELSRLVESHGAHFAVIGIPSRFELSAEEVDNERRYDLRLIRVDPLDRVANECLRLGIPFVDLRPRLRAERAAMEAGQREWDDLYTYDLTHLDEEGHRLAAEEVRSELGRRGWDRR